MGKSAIVRLQLTVTIPGPIAGKKNGQQRKRFGPFTKMVPGARYLAWRDAAVVLLRQKARRFGWNPSRPLFPGWWSIEVIVHPKRPKRPAKIHPGEPAPRVQRIDVDAAPTAVMDAIVELGLTSDDHFCARAVGQLGEAKAEAESVIVLTACDGPP